MSNPSLVTDWSFLPSNSQLLHGVLVDRIYHEQNFHALLAKALHERRRRHCGQTLPRDVVDEILSLLHAVDILLQRDRFVSRFGCLVAQQLCYFRTVSRVLMHSELEAFAELLVELLEVPM